MEYQKTAKATGDSIGNKIWGFPKIRSKIIQRQLQMRRIKKLKKLLIFNPIQDGGPKKAPLPDFPL